jgi:hypothetical protein
MTNLGISMENMRAKLSALWTFLMFNMVFADIFTFIYPGFMKQIVDGAVADGTQITPVFLLVAAIVTEISIAMVFLSRFLNYRVNRRVNIVGGIVTILWVVGGGSTMLHYIFFATVECVCALVIIWMAWNWRGIENQVS